MTQVQVDSYANVSKKLKNKLFTSIPVTNEDLSNSNAVTKLAKLGISFTLGNAPIGTKKFCY